MPTVSQSGLFTLQVLTDTGAPAANYRLYTFVAGTTTHVAAYTDSSGSTAHTYTSDGIGGQYIALNARGELPAPLWLQSGAYDIKLADPIGASVWTRRATGSIAPGGIGVFSAGTEANPGIAFDGDANTGIFSPAANQVSITTDGTERLNVNGSGAVAIDGPVATGALTVTGTAAISGKLNAGGTKVSEVFSLINLAGGTITTTLPYGDTATMGGGLLVVNGCDNAGQAFCALYLVCNRITNGATPTGSALLIDRTGAANPLLTVNVSSSGTGVITITVAATGSNQTYAYGIGF